MGLIERQQTATPYLHYLAQRLLIAGSFGLGIGYAYTLHLQMLFVLVCALAAGYALMYSYKQIFIQILFFAIGFTCLTYQHAQHKTVCNQIQNKILTIEATIESIEPVQHTLYRYVIIARVEKTIEPQTDTRIDAPWRIQCYTHLRPHFEIGDTVAFDRVKTHQLQEGSFYWYLVKESIHTTVFLTDNAYHIISHPTFHLPRCLHDLKHALLKRIRSKCPRTAFTLFSSIFLGNRNCVKKGYQEIKEQFHHWGIMHFLARSGLHLVLFILLLQLFLQRIPLPLIIKHIMMIGTTCIYAGLSWQSISFARACATFCWYKWCHITHLQIDVTTIVLLLSCIFLVCNPSLLLFLDFQLSFGLTLILSLTNQLGTAAK